MLYVTLACQTTLSMFDAGYKSAPALQQRAAAMHASQLGVGCWERSVSLRRASMFALGAGLQPVGWIMSQLVHCMLTTLLQQNLQRPHHTWTDKTSACWAKAGARASQASCVHAPVSQVLQGFGHTLWPSCRPLHSSFCLAGDAGCLCKLGRVLRFLDEMCRQVSGHVAPLCAIPA